MKVTELFEHITHIEELPLREFMYTATHLNQYTFTEKIDGAHLRVHLDDNSNLYVTRGGKNQHQAFYEANAMPMQPKYTYQRMALNALQAVKLPLIEAGLAPGDSFDIEVIYTEQPNTILYDGVNRVIILDNFNSNLSLPLVESAQILKVTVTVPVFNPAPDLTYEISTEAVDVHISTLPRLIFTESHDAIVEHVDKLNNFLSESSGIKNLLNWEIYECPLNKRHQAIPAHEWSLYKPMIKEARDKLREQVNVYKKIIKQLILEEAKTLAHGGYCSSQGAMEGLVGHAPQSKLFKVVDRGHFTELNKFYYKERKALTETAIDLEHVDSIKANIDVGYLSAFGLGEYATRGKKRQFDRFVVEQFCDNHFYDVIVVKNYLYEFLNATNELLYERHKEYIENQPKLEIVIEGVTYRYTDEIHRRTLLEYCNIQQYINDLKACVLESYTLNDLLKMHIVGD